MKIGSQFFTSFLLISCLTTFLHRPPLPPNNRLLNWRIQTSISAKSATIRKGFNHDHNTGTPDIDDRKNSDCSPSHLSRSPKPFGDIFLNRGYTFKMSAYAFSNIHSLKLTGWKGFEKDRSTHKEFGRQSNKLAYFRIWVPIPIVSWF